jgi:hypothetical protein
MACPAAAFDPVRAQQRPPWINTRTATKTTKNPALWPGVLLFANLAKLCKDYNGQEQDTKNG